MENNILARELFVSLEKIGNYLYCVQNDRNKLFNFSVDTDKEAVQVFNAWLKGGYRERYAVEKGNPVFNVEGFHNYIQFIIPDEPQSNSNGAIYSIDRKEWIN